MGGTLELLLQKLSRHQGHQLEVWPPRGWSSLESPSGLCLDSGPLTKVPSSVSWKRVMAFTFRWVHVLHLALIHPVVLHEPTPSFLEDFGSEISSLQCGSDHLAASDMWSVVYVYVQTSELFYEKAEHLSPSVIANNWLPASDTNMWNSPVMESHTQGWLKLRVKFWPRKLRPAEISAKTSTENPLYSNNAQ